MNAEKYTRKNKNKSQSKYSSKYSSHPLSKKIISSSKSIKISDSDVITISRPSAPRKLFYTHPKTAYHLSRPAFKTDKIIEFIDDNLRDLKKGKTIGASVIEQKLFNHDPENCICQNININMKDAKRTMQLEEDCKCNNMKLYPNQGKSGASISSIECNGDKDILKVMSLGDYYIKMRQETKKHIFIELDFFTIQTIINTYVYQELPMNTVAIQASGVCTKERMWVFGKKYQGYNLMDEANLGTGQKFAENLIHGKLDENFNIAKDSAFGRDTRYKMFVNFLLQVVFIIGHLQSSSLELFHGDLKPDNVFVKRLEQQEHAFFYFIVSGKMIKIPNLGFAVLIADFDKSSITLKSQNLHNKNRKTYRIIPSGKFQPLLDPSITSIITKYGNSDSNKIKTIKMNKFGVSKIIPKSKDPTLTILRAAGVHYFRDMDLYTFMIMLLNNNHIMKYVIENKLDETIMSFMTDKFKARLFKTDISNIGINQSAFLVLDILEKIKEPMQRIFTTHYIKTLDLLNLYLFEPK